MGITNSLFADIGYTVFSCNAAGINGKSQGTSAGEYIICEPVHTASTVTHRIEAGNDPDPGLCTPDIPVLRKTMTVAGTQVSSPASFNIAKDAEQLVIDVDIFGYVYPYVGKELEYGNFSKEPIIENFQLQGDRFTIDLWGKDAAVICFNTDCDIECPEGTVQRKEDVTTLTLNYKDQWQRKSITCKIKRNL